MLPAARAWTGASRTLVAPADDAWLTPFEASGLTRTPRYDETMAWLARLDKASQQVEMVSLGKSGEGRDVWMVIASQEGALTPDRLRASGKPVVLVQAGIHSGEIDGKDAGMMLLRDMTVRATKKDLLEKASFLFIPIFNVDGHERFSRFARINQRGPLEQGWRTTSSNLNLNRDYTKLDAPETQALVRALNLWQPDLYIDVHVTDGIDYQYDVTWGGNSAGNYSPATQRWLESVLRPALERDLRAMGHVPGPLLFASNNTDLSEGIINWASSPRFSNGYGDVRHLPTILVENHSLKPYDQRVLGTYVFLESVLRTLGARVKELRRAAEQDRSLRPAEFPVEWKAADGPPPTFEFLGIGSRADSSAVSGGKRVTWTGTPITQSVPYVQFTKPVRMVRVPKAYWIAPQWTDVIARLQLHGIQMERIAKERELDVEMFRVPDAALEPEPFEGRARVTGTPVVERRHERFPAGSVRIPIDQPLGELAVVLLDPASDDSFFRWGFFLSALQPTEYVEAYVMEPIAQRMLAADPALRAEFAQRLKDDPKFAADPQARLLWFYRRTPFSDDRWKLVPVARE